MATPRKKTTHDMDVRTLARAHTTMAVKVLASIAQQGTSESARVNAATVLIERGWGKSPQPHTGDDGGDIRVTIRTIIDGGK